MKQKLNWLLAGIASLNFISAFACENLSDSEKTAQTSEEQQMVVQSEEQIDEVTVLDEEKETQDQ